MGGPRRSIRPGTRLCVHGLPAGIKKTALQAAFGEFGDVVRIEVPQDQPVAFIEFEEPNDATEAARDMDGKTIERQRVNVRLVDDRPRAMPDHAIRIQQEYVAIL